MESAFYPMFCTGSGATFEKPIFSQKSLGFTNHINSMMNNNGNPAALIIAGSGGLIRGYSSDIKEEKIYSYVSQNITTIMPYFGPVFGGGGDHYFAAAEGGSIIKKQSGSPTGYTVSFKRFPISQLGAGTVRTVASSLNDGIFYAGSTIVTGGRVRDSTLSSETFTTRSSGTTYALYGGVTGTFKVDDSLPYIKTILVGANAAFTYSSDGGITWSASRILNSTQQLNAVATAAGKIVAVGNNGTIFYCNTHSIPPGSTLINANIWIQCTSPTTQHLYAVCGPYILPERIGTSQQDLAKRKFWLAVGNNGTIISSQNGIDWQLCVSPTTQKLNCVVATKYFGSYAIGGQSGTFLIGNDGT